MAFLLPRQLKGYSAAAKKLNPFPALPSAAPTPTAPAPPADPKDAQYFNDLAKLGQQYTTSRAGLTALGGTLNTQYQRGLGDLASQQPKDILATKQNANKAGLFYAGELGKRLGEVETNYAKRRSQLAESYQGAESERVMRLSDLDASLPLAQNDALLGGVQRGLNRDALNPPPSPLVKPPAFASYSGVSKLGKPGVWHIYPDGRKLFVAKK